MCGVLGGFGPLMQGLDASVLLRAIEHRGPDAEGHFRAENLLLAHTRLAIIDLAEGGQPMFSSSGRFVIVYNGEIYNYRELRAELKGKGATFRTNSDTEVVLAAFEQWGSDCFLRFRGMFAFALADLRERNAWLVRDHFGIKPLFYRTTDSSLLFGSELGALLDVLPAGLEVVPERLDFFLRYRHIPAPLTIYRDAFKVEPGTALNVDFTGSIRRTLKFYSATLAPTAAAPANQEVELERTLRDSVRAHLIADVPRGVLLSGGVDSSLITLLAREEDSELVSGYTIVSDADSAVGDAASARELAKRVGLRHREKDASDESVAMLPALLRHFGEPFGDSSILPTYVVSALAREDVKVALSGEGADEVFAGYPQYARWLRGDPGRLPMQNGLKEMMPGRFLAGVNRWLSRPRAHTENVWESAMAVCSYEQRRRIWGSEWKNLSGRPCDPITQAVERSAHLDPLSFAQDMHLQTNLANDMLAKADVAAMHVALEVRTPFLDVDVVEFARQIPVAQRIEMDWTGGARTKAPLKKLLARHVGSEFVDRPKRGFEIARNRFFLKGTLSHEMLHDLFLCNKELNRLFDMAECSAWLDTPVENSDRLFLLLALGVWWSQWGKTSSIV